MPLINTSVPNLIQGVSQQPDATRFAGQCEEQENAMSSVVSGLMKRPNTRHVGRLLGEALDSDSFVHFINRDINEKYVVIISKASDYASSLNCFIRAFNLTTGQACDINGSTSVELSAASFDYLKVNKPAEALKALTLGDTTLLLNTLKTVLNTNQTTESVSPEALLFVKQGDYGTNYDVSIQGNFTPVAGQQASIGNPSITQNTADGTYYINNNLTVIGAGSGYEQGFVSVNVTSNGNIITQPQFAINVNSNGGISQVNVLNAGKFASIPSGTNTENFEGEITSYSQTSDALVSSSTYSSTYMSSVTFDVTLTQGNASLLTVGETISLTTASTNKPKLRYIYYPQSGSLQYREISRLSATVINSTTLRYSRNFYYTINQGNYSGYKWREQTIHNQHLGNQTAFENFANNPTVSFSKTYDTFGAPTLSASISGPTTSTQVARLETSVTTPNGANAEDFTASGGLSSTNNTNDREEIDTSVIAEKLSGAIQTEIGAHNQQTNFTCSHSNNLIVITPNTSSVVGYTISVADGLANNALGMLYKEVASVSDLPLYCKNNFSIKVAGEQSEIVDDYYVKFKTNDGSAFGRGVWEETVGFDEKYEFNNTTLPYSLVSVSENNFVLSATNGSSITANSFTHTFNSWGQKTAGDEQTNPAPSFVNKTISNMFFFKNRLGFIADDSVVLSESGDLFNFYRLTVSTLLDSSPIDVSVSSGGVTNLKSAVAFQSNLILFSENGQFVLKGGDILTPKTVSIASITNFNFENNAEPVPLGSYIYFPFTRGNFTGVREFTVNSTTDTYDSVEITEHIPAYIPKNIIDMAGTTSEDMIAILSGDERSSLYIYNYFWNNNKKVLSAWSKFTFTDEIRGMEFIESTLYMVMSDNSDNTHLVSLPLESGLKDTDHNGSSSSFLTLLDKRVRAKMTSGSDLIEFEKSDGTYSSANGDLPYTYFSGTIPTGGATLSEVFVDSTGTTHAIKALNTNGMRVHLSNGNASSTLYGYVGIPYTMRYKFSTQVFKASSGNSASPTNASEMQVRNGTVFFDDAHTFDVKVTPEHRSTVSTTFSANDRPDADQLGTLKVAEGNFRFPVYSKAKHADILIENSSPFDSKFSSAEFESFVHPRSNRYG